MNFFNGILKGEVSIRERIHKSSSLWFPFIPFDRQHPPKLPRGSPDVVEERRGGLFAATTLGTAPWGVIGDDRGSAR